MWLYSRCFLILIGATVHVVKRSDLHIFSVIPKRWVVVERLLNTSLQLVNLAFGGL